ncbi:4Fe-4S binding protein [Adlercreutzia equolifaciens]|uniref:ATP-binding protein n=1 Tax=Adlercreutzia equolifaciens TaxID=446660 RepID=UPI0023AEDE97|nr:4Fe-4S binding protein [Adlercreutzia equolifaciens]MDE8702556.1 4Fe-4S binding protein [Adlercreutzia equolifaciens]
MLRTVIQIDEEKCTGCRLCVDACHEGAIGMVDGKARLLRDDYCDGLGDCLPACPTGAITFIEREAAAYDEHAVAQHLAARAAAEQIAEDDLDRTVANLTATPTGCPGSRARSLVANATSEEAKADGGEDVFAVAELPSRLVQWPAQIKLVPTQAPYYNGRGLLIAADCTAFACASFHERFMKGNVTIIGCPKLDQGSYAEKLAAIMADNDVTSVTIARMEVPCCGGLERDAAQAVALSGKDLPLNVVTFSVTGNVIA